MGRTRVPDRLKELAGTNRKDRMNPDAPEPDVCIPDPPAFVAGAALEEWERITPELEALGIISVLDLGVLAAYCMAYGEFSDATREWQGKGSPMTTTSANGIEMVHPLKTIIGQSREQMRKFANELGITPAARSKVSGKKKGSEKQGARLGFLQVKK